MQPHVVARHTNAAHTTVQAGSDLMVLRGTERLEYSPEWRITDTEIEQTGTAAAAATTEAQRLKPHSHSTRGRLAVSPKHLPKI